MHWKRIFPLLTLLILLISASTGYSQPEFTEHEIRDRFAEATGVHAADMDGDGDIDVVGSAFESEEVAWFENEGEDGFTYHSIDDNFSGAQAIFTADFNRDGHMDFIAAAINDGDVSWWENDGDGGFGEHSINNNFSRPYDVYCADVDSDGDMDALGVNYTGNAIVWWDSDGQGDFRQNQIDGNFTRSSSVFAADMDGDGDMDVLGASGWGNQVAAWWENDGDQRFTRRNLGGRASNISAADLDGDGDMDAFGGAQYTDEFFWWENDGEDDPSFDEHLIDDEINDPSAVTAADLDNDGDLDLVVAAWAEGTFQWWENDGEDDPSFEQHLLSEDRNGACSVMVIDIDDDGDIDILGAARGNTDALYWWENDLDPNQNEGPSPTRLVSPADNSVIDSLSVILEWRRVPNVPDSIFLQYRVEWALSPEFDEFEFADVGAEIDYTIEELADDTDYWWRVYTIDPETALETVSEEIWKFSTAMPEPPTDFGLLEPADNTRISPEEFSALEFSWESSLDPDPGDTVRYDLNIVVDVNGDSNRLSYNGLIDAELTLNLVDSLELDFWEDELTMMWFVEAISNEDITDCNESFQATVEPRSGIGEDQTDGIPDGFGLLAAYPNPFNSVTTIEYSLPTPGEYSLSLFDPLGREVVSLVEGYSGPGKKVVTLDGKMLESGIYFVILNGQNHTDLKKITLIK